MLFWPGPVRRGNDDPVACAAAVPQRRVVRGRPVMRRGLPELNL